MPTAEKIEIVNSLKDKFGRAQSYVFLDYRGLTMLALNQLRASLSQLGASLQVAKNTLIEKAAGLKNEGPTAIIFTGETPLETIKALANFIKNNPSMTVKSGLFEGKTYGGPEILAIAALPTRAVLLSQLVLGLKFPLYRLTQALSGSQRNLLSVLARIASKKS